MIIWPTPRPAVKTAISILTDAFTGTTVSYAMPRTRPAKIVLVSRVGGGQENPRMDRARLLIECWAKTIGDAEAMTATARAALRNSGGTTVDGVFIYGWDGEDGPVMYDDPDVTDMTRWQFSGDLSVSTR
jgi:hypothetical protein